MLCGNWCWFAKFVDDLNDFEVDATELYCIQFDKERVCWFLRMNIFAVLFFLCVFTHRMEHTMVWNNKKNLNKINK